MHFKKEASLCDRVIVSSKSSAEDYRRFAPEHAGKVGIYSFVSAFGLQSSSLDPKPEVVLDRYGIDRDFLLVVNQFWLHKNHKQIIEAMGILLKDNRCPYVVMIGQPTDYRDLEGKMFSELLNRVAELRLGDRLKILGFVPRNVRDGLMRCCKAMIQPSMSEGWNVSIEDAKALGRPVIVSDIPVHREQLPEAIAFVPINDIESMASAIMRADKELPPGPDVETERIGLNEARTRLLKSGQTLLRICKDAIAVRGHV